MSSDLSKKSLIVKAVNRETFTALFIIIAIFAGFASVMGLKNMFGTMFATAHDLILNTVLFIMAVAVLTGALTSVMAEFGIIAMLNRIMGSLLDGGKTGVDLGLAIIPGNVVICTLVMMLVRGASSSGEFTGGSMEGIALLPYLAEKISFIIDPLFGFTSPEAIAFPCTAVGSVGASLGMVPNFLKEGLIGPNDIAVFTAMGMTYSGYLSVHVAMMDALNCRELASKAIFSHTIAGLCAGVMAHWFFVGFSTFL